MSGRRVAATALAALVAAAGCTHGAYLYARGGSGAPALGGRSVAVLPTFALGVEQGPALLATRAADAVFGAPLRGVRFVPPCDVLVRLEAEPGALEALRARALERLPVDPPREGRRRKLFEGSQVLGEEIGRRVALRVREGSALPDGLAPEALEPALLAPFASDYVLVSVAYATWVQLTVTTALIGVLPFAREEHVLASEPRIVYALYRSEDGARTFEIFVSGEGIREDADYGGPIDPRLTPVVVAAERLTGALEEPLARAVRMERAER